MFVQQFVIRKNSNKHFRLTLLTFCFILNSVFYLGNFSSVLHILHNRFPYQKSSVKVHVNVVTLPELKILCGKSNEINGETKVVLCSTAKKNLFAFDKV